jgi:hypothetical protein
MDAQQLQQLDSKLTEIDGRLLQVETALTPLLALSNQIDEIGQMLSHLPTLPHITARLDMLENAVQNTIPIQINDSVAGYQDVIVERTHEKVLATVLREVGNLREELQVFNREALTICATKEDLNNLTRTTSTTQPKKEPKIAPPPVFTGKREDCKSFLSHCLLVFGSNPTTYPDDRSKIRYALSYLAENPKKFFLDYISQLDLPRAERPSPVRTFESFSSTLTDSFGISHSDVWAETQLRTLRQTGFAVDYTARFRTLAKMTTWNDSALCSQYTLGLKESIQDKLAEQERILELERLITKVHQIDNMQRANVALKTQSSRAITAPLHTRQQSSTPATHARQQNQASFASSSSRPPPADKEPASTLEPMDLSQATRLSPQERAHRREAKLCYYCGKSGHMLSACPSLRNKQQVLHQADAESAADTVEFSLEKDEA